jgi:hypothetical protein
MITTRIVCWTNRTSCVSVFHDPRTCLDEARAWFGAVAAAGDRIHQMVIRLRLQDSRNGDETDEIEKIDWTTGPIEYSSPYPPVVCRVEPAEPRP